jgi:hypothetical protein
VSHRPLPLSLVVTGIVLEFSRFPWHNRFIIGKESSDAPLSSRLLGKKGGIAYDNDSDDDPQEGRIPSIP